MIIGNKNYRNAIREINALKMEEIRFNKASKKKMEQLHKQNDDSCKEIAYNLGRMIGRMLSKRGEK